MFCSIIRSFYLFLVLACCSLFAATAPTITTRPANISVTTGQTASFSVVAAGTAPLTYQWMRGGTAIAGATSVSYTTPATVASDNGTVFTVKVTNSVGNATSSAATLTVTTVPSITTQPTSKAVIVGQTASFSVRAAGTTPLTYQWMKGGTAISGATSASYTTPAAVSGDNAAKFTVKVTNVAGNVTSSAATLTVNVPPSITTQPVAKTVSAGQTATFTAVASGTAPLTYQWMKNSASISGATLASYTTPATIFASNNASFTVKVTNAAGSMISNAALLTVKAPPAIVTQPVSQTINLGGSATFSVVANGTMPFSCQWMRNGIVITGATSASYTTPATVASDNGLKYTVKITNSYGNITSAAATLKVNIPVSISTQPSARTVTVGQTATFTVGAGGTSPFTYQWSRNGTAISGATAASYTTLAAANSDNGALYAVTVVNAFGSVTSAAVALTVIPDFLAFTPPAAVVEAGGQVVITANQPVTWYSNGYFTMYPTSNAATCTMTPEGSTDNLPVGTYQLYAYSTTYPSLQATVYTRDHLGSIRELTDSSQTIRARYDYDPYGRMTKVSGDRDSQFTYTGHFWHGQSGLNLTLFRAYDPNLGRWISRDPIGEVGGINVYQYLKSDPIDKVDIYGLSDGNCQDWLDCMDKCMKKFDPLSALPAIPFVPVPKWLVGMPRIGGSTAWTNLGSRISLGGGTAVSGANVGRVISRTPGMGALAVGAGYGAVSVGCAIACGIDPDTYTNSRPFWESYLH